VKKRPMGTVRIPETAGARGSSNLSRRRNRWTSNDGEKRKIPQEAPRGGGESHETALKEQKTRNEIEQTPVN